jgi:hypothetical protein
VAFSLQNCLKVSVWVDVARWAFGKLNKLAANTRLENLLPN